MGKGLYFCKWIQYWQILGNRTAEKALHTGTVIEKGENEIIVFETEGKIRDTIVLKGEPDIG